MQRWATFLTVVVTFCGLIIIPSGDIYAYPSGYRLPFDGRIVVTAGPTPHESQYHTGPSSEAMDFQAPDRKAFPIYAVAAGTAYYFPWAEADGFGNTVLIQHDDRLWSLYAHLDKVVVRDSQRVNQGDYIGDSGNSGNGQGFHLHFEIRANCTSRNNRPNIYSGTAVKIVDHPDIHYIPNLPCCKRGYAIGGGTGGESKAPTHSSGSSAPQSHPLVCGPVIVPVDECRWDVLFTLSGFAPNSMITVTNTFSQVTCEGKYDARSWTAAAGPTDSNGYLRLGYIHGGPPPQSHHFTFSDNRGNSVSLPFTYTGPGTPSRCVG